MLIEVGWKKESRSLSSAHASPQLSNPAGAGEDPFASITDMINRSDAPVHQGDCAMIKQVESLQIQHSTTRIGSGRGRHSSCATYSTETDVDNQEDLEDC